MIFVFGETGNYFASTDKEVDAKRLQEFNAQYEVFNRKLLYGTDIISVANKAVSDKKTKGVEVSVSATIKQANSTIFTSQREYKEDELEEIAKTNNPKYEKIREEVLKGKPISDLASDQNYGAYKDYQMFKLSTFKCTGVEYEDSTGAVQKLKFEQLMQGSFLYEERD